MIKTTHTFNPDDLVAHVYDQAKRGLQSLAPTIEDTMANTRAHGDQTGATRDGYRCYVIGSGLAEQATAMAALNSAVNAVERLNPGHSAVTDHPLPDVAIGVALTSPTDYQEKLETENAGLRAVLIPTIHQFIAQLKDAARGAK